MIFLCACLQALDERMTTFGVELDVLCESVSSDDDRVSNLVMKYKAIRTAVAVSLLSDTYLHQYSQCQSLSAVGKDDMG